ncbi:MAG: hypothetical protein IIA45_13590 [Bacteroidetes bacterium]|nr:hypothetical protein [Bacteroidota bacterium]
MEFEKDGDYRRKITGIINDCGYEYFDCFTTTFTNDCYYYDSIVLIDALYQSYYYGAHPDGHFSKRGDWQFQGDKDELEIIDDNGKIEIYDIIGLSNSKLHLIGDIDWDGDGTTEEVEIEATKL